MRATSLAVMASLAVALGACTSPRTQVMLRFEADPGIERDTNAIRLTVTGMPGGAPTVEMRDATLGSWPHEAAIVPTGGDATRTFTAVAEALDAEGAVLGTVAIDTGFVAGRTLLAVLRFEDACRGVACGPNQTCDGGTCSSALRTGLPDYTPPVPSDAGDARDAGADDAPSDVGPIDAPPDGGMGPLFGEPQTDRLGGCLGPLTNIAPHGDEWFVGCADAFATFEVVELAPAFIGLTVLGLGEVARYVEVADVDSATAGPELLVVQASSVAVYGLLPPLGLRRTLPLGASTSPDLAVRGPNGMGYDELVVASDLGLHVLGGSGALRILATLPDVAAQSMVFVPDESMSSTDLVVVGEANLETRVFSADGSAAGGLATTPSTVYADGSATPGVYVRAADFNRDLYRDLYVLHGFDPFTTAIGTVDVLAASLDGGMIVYERSARRVTGPGPGVPTTCDLNGDDVPDLVVPHAGLEGTGYPVRVLFSDGDGDFGADALTLLVPDPARAVACADPDDDGDFDLLVLHGEDGVDGYVSVFPNQRL